MENKTLTSRQVAEKLNLSRVHVRKLVKTEELVATRQANNRLVFLMADVEAFSVKLRERRLASLKLIARASEEAGLYDIDDC